MSITWEGSSIVATLSSIKAVFVSFWSGFRHLFKPRMTLRYPEQKLDLEGQGTPSTPSSVSAGRASRDDTC